MEKLPKGEMGLMHGYFSVNEIKAVAKKYDVSINEYLVALYAYSTYNVCLHRMKPKHPIRVAVPVNLRPYFKSMTTKNFFVMVSAEFDPVKDDYSFEEVIDIIKKDLRRQINKENLEDLFSYSVSNQMRTWMRMMPYFVKSIAMRLVYNQSAMANTTTVTNIGNIAVDDEYSKYIKQFAACIAMSKGQKLKGTICSYKDTMVFTFSSSYYDTSLQGFFFKHMVEEGINVTVETNGVYL